MTKLQIFHTNKRLIGDLHHNFTGTQWLELVYVAYLNIESYKDKVFVFGVQYSLESFILQVALAIGRHKFTIGIEADQAAKLYINTIPAHNFVENIQKYKQAGYKQDIPTVFLEKDLTGWCCDVMYHKEVVTYDWKSINAMAHGIYKHVADKSIFDVYLTSFFIETPKDMILPWVCLLHGKQVYFPDPYNSIGAQIKKIQPTVLFMHSVLHTYLYELSLNETPHKKSSTHFAWKESLVRNLKNLGHNSISKTKRLAHKLENILDNKMLGRGYFPSLKLIYIDATKRSMSALSGVYGYYFEDLIGIVTMEAKPLFLDRSIGLPLPYIQHHLGSQSKLLYSYDFRAEQYKTEFPVQMNLLGLQILNTLHTSEQNYRMQSIPQIEIDTVRHSLLAQCCLIDSAKNLEDGGHLVLVYCWDTRAYFLTAAEKKEAVYNIVSYINTVLPKTKTIQKSIESNHRFSTYNGLLYANGEMNREAIAAKFL
jgi:hypothetical protein